MPSVQLPALLKMLRRVASSIPHDLREGCRLTGSEADGV